MTALWTVLAAAGRASKPQDSCAGTAKALACTDAAFAALCPATCAICVNNIHLGEHTHNACIYSRPVTAAAAAGSVAYYQVLYQHAQVEYAEQLALWTCANTRRLTNDPLNPCPAGVTCPLL